MPGKSTHLQVIPQQNIQNFAISDMQEKLADFFLLYDTGVEFSSRNNFANLGSFAKFFVSVESNSLVLVF